MYLSMLAGVYLMFVPCTLCFYALCCVLHLPLFIIVVSCMHVPLFMYISLSHIRTHTHTRSLSLSLSLSLSESTMVNEHCTAQY